MGNRAAPEQAAKSVSEADVGRPGGGAERQGQWPPALDASKATKPAEEKI